MNRVWIVHFGLVAVVAFVAADTWARGPGGRGGGGSRGGGAPQASSRPSTSRSPSMSRPAGNASRPTPSTLPSGATRPTAPASGTRPKSPNTSAPAAGARPGSPSGARPGSPSGARPGSPSGARPGVSGNAPSQGQLKDFLDIPSSGSLPAAERRPASAGNAASDFLQNRPSQGSSGPVDPRSPERREAANRLDGADRLDTADRLRDRDRSENLSDRSASDDRQARLGERAERSDGRQDRRDDLARNSPARINDLDQRQDDRIQRRDQVRDQVRENNPRLDFWMDNPNYARWRWNRPYRWATWGAVSTWFPWGWGNPIRYNYGDNVYYVDNTVYYGDQALASSEEYAEQALAIADSAGEPSDTSEWMSLGVFALTQDGPASGPEPIHFLQLAVSKEGVIAGTLYNSETDVSQEVEGAVDRETQRAAWVIVGKQWPIMETGISNLTDDESPALVHFEGGQTQQWLMIRLEDPQTESGK